MRRAAGDHGYHGLKVFTATTLGRRDGLGEDVTAWLRAHPERIPVLTFVRQSSDARFHCLSILIFWRTESERRATL